ncbi:MAG: tol-pal system-associated acyl-CoA thioesterase [Gammaproteobacteria bacterium]|nr:tol-pal system-associated acyl-CoA thioesterase [Gammaproteobacteria bacterium]
MKEFNWPVRVYYEDTDAAGVVYHSNYLKFMERARTEWLRELGVSQQRLREESNTVIVIASADIKFMKPAKLDDCLTIKATLLSSGSTSLVCEQMVQRENEDLCSARVKCVCVNSTTFKPQRIPAELKSEMTL